MKTNLFLCVLLAALLSACSAKQPPYFKHKLVAWEPVAADCAKPDPSFKVEASIVSHLYKFEHCLPASFSGAYVAERRGDTVAIRFANASGPRRLYNLTLKIDTYPGYRFFTLDGTTYAVALSQP